MRRVYGLVLLLIGLALWSWFTSRQSGALPPALEPVSEAASKPDSVAEERDLASALVAATVSTPGTRRDGQSPPSLPGAMPVSQLFAALAPRADAGDVSAGCRLAHALVGCQANLRLILETDEQLARTEARYREAGAPVQQIERLWSNAQWNRVQRAECSQIPAEAFRQIPWYNLRAALHGNVMAMVSFASLDGVSMADLIADPALYAQYQQRGFPLWLQALKRGSFRAMGLWSRALRAEFHSPLRAVLPTEYQDSDRLRALRNRITEGLSIPFSIRPALAAAGGQDDRAGQSPTPEAVAWAEAFFEAHLIHSSELVRTDAQLREYLASITSPDFGPPGPPSTEAQALYVSRINEACESDRD